MLYSVQHLEHTIYELRDKLKGRPTKEAHTKLREQNKELRAQLKAIKDELAVLLKEREKLIQQIRSPQSPFTSTRNAKRS